MTYKKVTLLFNSYVDLEQFRRHYFTKLVKKISFVLYGQSQKKNQLYFYVDKIIECSDSDVLNFLSTVKYKKIKIESVDEVLDWKFSTNNELKFQILKRAVAMMSYIVEKSSYFELDIREQDLAVESILMDIASVNKYGPEFGYLSFLSNIKYFESQVKAVFSSADTTRVMNAINDLTVYDSVDFDKKPYRDLKGIEYLEEILFLLEKYQDKIDYVGLPDPNAFFSNAKIKMEYSDFHKNFYTDYYLIERYKKTWFLNYRILMSVIMGIFPLLNISLNRRNKIINLFVKHIEASYSISWDEQLKKIKEENHDNNKK
ncbi:hypothetical protein [Leuconostoc citreum]|uniref:hypothetical protein n=1 Tax=Leuconostoc citreum TaxID=33964 RepID=UPI0032DF61CD